MLLWGPELLVGILKGPQLHELHACIIINMQYLDPPSAAV